MVALVDSVQTVVQVPLTRFWAAMRDSSTLLPKVLPDVFAKVEPVEGLDGSAGSIRILTFGPAVPLVKFIKERVEAVDEENHTVVTSVVDGGLLGIVFSMYKVTISYSAAEGTGTSINWSVEYESLVENPSLEESKQGALISFHAIETFLLSNNEEYSSGVEVPSAA